MSEWLTQTLSKKLEDYAENAEQYAEEKVKATGKPEPKPELFLVVFDTDKQKTNEIRSYIARILKGEHVDYYMKANL
jgi:hypothetical protein